jgi:threonine dehydratase
VIPVAEIRRAREVLDGVAIRTPLVRLDVESESEIWLKLEVLQPVRSFKIRGAGNAVLQASDEELAGGRASRTRPGCAGCRRRSSRPSTRRRRR